MKSIAACRVLFVLLTLVIPSAGEGLSSSVPQPRTLTAFESFRTLGKSSRLCTFSEVKSPGTILEDVEDYSNSLLSRKEQRFDIKSEESNQYAWRRPFWQQVLLSPLEFFQQSGKAKKRPGALILMRTGQSEYHAAQTFTGWADPDLTPVGIEECAHAGRLLLAEGLIPDVVYTSRLTRAVKSAWTVLEVLDKLYIPVFKTYRLNQRMYGALQGLSKAQVTREFGPDVVRAWRYSLKAKPPAISRTDPSYPGQDRRYRDLTEDQIPLTESLLDCQKRAEPVWACTIRHDLQAGLNVLVVAHRDTLRGIIKQIDNIDDEMIQEISVPPGVPFVYRFDRTLQPIQPKDDHLVQIHTTSVFLEEPGAMKAALDRREIIDGTLKGIDTDFSNFSKRRDRSVKESLSKLRYEQNLINQLGSESELDHIQRWTDDPTEFEEYDEFADADQSSLPVNVIPLPQAIGKLASNLPYVVLVRHGRTPHNNLGLFTGWEDPPLTSDGVDEARLAGKLLKSHGFYFDVVYTSWLTRAIQTAYHILDELDCKSLLPESRRILGTSDMDS
jgi:2,3-bisphosphoglycerate-dependent phosphoglycerate mutase